MAQRGHLGQALVLGLPSTAQPELWLPSEPREGLGEPRCPRSPVRGCGSPAALGAPLPSEPLLGSGGIGQCLPRAGPVALRHRRGAGVSRGEDARTRRRHRDTSPPPRASARAQGLRPALRHLSAPSARRYSPRGCRFCPVPPRCPHLPALTCSRRRRTRGCSAPEPSPHLHRQHRPPGGCCAAHRVM